MRREKKKKEKRKKEGWEAGRMGGLGEEKREREKSKH